ncbi:hypothetical protein YC2023_089403 [Brassica napus]
MAPTSKSHKASAFTATLKRIVKATVLANPVLGSKEHNERKRQSGSPTNNIHAS